MSWFQDQEANCVDQLLVFLCCFDRLLCSLQTIISQNPTCVCTGKEAPLLLAC